jgi:predicted nucleotidyltransferase
MLRVDAARPLDGLTLAALRAFRGVAADAQWFVCGAMARDILAWHVHGVPLPGATRDVDLAIAVPGWDAFAALQARLADQHGFVAEAASPGRLRLPGAAGRPGYPVDLIPFGGVEGSEGALAWPPDGRVIMNVLGFRDALAAACVVTVGPGLDVPVASLPMLAVLKLLAWQDRRRVTAKDARDFAFLLSAYSGTLGSARLYDEEAGVMAGVDYDLEQAGARLLGSDAARMLSAATHRAVLAVVEDSRIRDALVTEVAAAHRGRDDAVAVAATCVGQFVLGLRATPG